MACGRRHDLQTTTSHRASDHRACGQRKRDRPRCEHDAAMLQLAVFTRAEALADGWTPAKIRTQLKSSNWTPLTRGRYVETSWLRDASPEERHALHAMAIGHQRNLV